MGLTVHRGCPITGSAEHSMARRGAPGGRRRRRTRWAYTAWNRVPNIVSGR